MDIHGLSPSDMSIVDKVFTNYIRRTYGDENDARMKTVMYLKRVLGWNEKVSMRAASIAIEDGIDSPESHHASIEEQIKNIRGLSPEEVGRLTSNVGKKNNTHDDE